MDIPASLGFEHGVWFRIRQGIRGILVPDEKGGRRRLHDLRAGQPLLPDHDPRFAHARAHRGADLTGSPHGLFVIRSKQKVRSERAKAVSIATTDEPMTSGEGPGWIPSPLYRLTLEQEYEAMVDSGVFSGRDRLHLIGGYLVAKMTQNDLHATAGELCGEALGRTIPTAGMCVRPSRSGLQARLASRSRTGALPGKHSRVPASQPGAGRHRSGGRDLGHGSLGEDRKQAALDAAAGIPVYWIVNLVDRQLRSTSSRVPRVMDRVRLL